MNKYKGLSQNFVDSEIRAGRGNVLPKELNATEGSILFRNIFTFFNLLNFILAILILQCGNIKNVLFLGVVFTNIAIGTIQEIRAKRMHDKLSLLIQSDVHVIRNGNTQLCSAEELVLNDIVLLSRGKQVPADCFILEGYAEADESLLTGESTPQPKKTCDTLLSGSYLISGHVVAQVQAVGPNCYAGKLQTDARKVKRVDSELMKDLQNLIRIITLILIPVGLILFWKQYFVLKLPYSESITKTVASVIGMIPEGLMLLTSVSLAAGIIKLGSSNVLVNELHGIEALARTDVLCMDKTGTLTNGKLKVVQIVPESPFTVQMLGMLIYALSDESSSTISSLKERFTPIESKPKWINHFSSSRKWSSAAFIDYGTIYLGAPEILLAHSEDLLSQAKSYSKNGNRVIAVAYTSELVTEERLADCFTHSALIIFNDLLRDGVQETIRYFDTQGVQLKIFSGDAVETVVSIANAAAVPNADKVIDLHLLGEKDYSFLAENYTVFCRVTPDDKRCLIQALQKSGMHAAMIGDGVNDIPALKAADCSIAISGGCSAVSRIANITLMNNDFNVLPSILLEGRRVINNISRAASMFLIKNQFSLLLSVFLVFLPFEYPFAPIQLTLISSLMIGLPSFILALQPNHVKVSGSFLKSVFCNALPGGIGAFLFVFLCLISGKNQEWTSYSLSSLCTIVAGISCFVSLAFICHPFNRTRIMLAIACLVMFIASIILFPGFFSLQCPTGNQWIPVLLAFFGSILIHIIARMLSSRIRRKKEVGL